MNNSIRYLRGLVVVLILSSALLWSMSRLKPSAVPPKPIQQTVAQKSILYFNRGNEGIRNLKYKLAIKEYTKAIELDPNNASAYINRALAKSRENDFWGSIEDYSIAKKIDPNLEKAVQADFQAGFYEIKDK